MAEENNLLDKYRILQVEDNPGDARLVQIYAQNDPHSELTFDSVKSLASAIEKLQTEDYDLILLDLNLPDSQGLDTLNALVDRDLFVPVIVLTGMDDQQLALNAVKLGAQDYLLKGPNLENSFSRAVRYAMERYQLFMVQRELALRDELTGLHNRRGLRLLADQQFRLAERRKERISLLLADIDDMKAINDQFGHKLGDQALRDTARVMKLTFRTSDVLARIGGDEFVVLALDTSREAEGRLIERWHREFEKYSKASQQPYEIAISIGIATSDPDEEFHLDEMITAADENMYQMKKDKTAGKGS